MPAGLLSRYQSEAHGLMRIVVGFLFMTHGGQKLFGWFGAEGPSRLAHRADRLRPRRRDGGRILLEARIRQRVLALAKPRRAGGVVLVRVSVSCNGWEWRL